MNMQQVARGWFVYELTESAVDLAWVTISFMLPKVLFSLPGGVLADRFPKRFILTVSLLINALLALLMAWFIFDETATFYHFIAFGVVSGSLLTLSAPSRTAMIPTIIVKRLVFSALALNTTAMNIARVLAPVLAGVLIAWIAGGDTSSNFGVAVVYLAITLLYLVSAISTRFVTVPGGAHEDYDPKHPVAVIKDGLTYVWRHPTVFALIALSIMPFLFGFSLNTLLPAFNEDVLHGGPESLGILISALGIGAILGSLFLAVSSGMENKGRWLFVSTVLWGVVTITFGLVSNMFSVVLVVGAVGALSSWNMAMNRGLLQKKVRPKMFGRVMSIDMMSHGLMPLGLLSVGIVADAYGVNIAIAFSGTLLLISLAVLYFSTGTLKHLMKRATADFV